ncbi:MAG TPA: aldo/keto reductase, partial [Bacillota bacterium]|nr:aldo/keto reductase [Bacillota bacterium]
MQYRDMKKLGLKLSVLSFGGMRLPHKNPLLGPGIDEKKAIRVIRRGIDLGINYIDTAYFYHFGASERIIGEALKDGYRDKVYLADKSPLMIMRKPEDFERYLEIQLKRLQTDTIDFYLFHGMNRSHLKKVIDFKLLEKMEAAKKSGLIKYIGFSFHDTLPVFKTIIDLYPWDMVQIQYNYLDIGTQATGEGLRYADEKGIPVVIMEGLKGGKLANPPQEALDIIRNAPVQKTPVEWAFQFLWNLKEVTTVLSGMNSLAMIEENCAYADRSGIGSFSAVESNIIDSLTAIYQKKILVGCTSCSYCMPCPHGVNIPENFALINNANGPGGIFRWMITRRYHKLASNPRRVNCQAPNGAASLCTQCQACVPKCPQGIQIPEEL